MAPGLVKHDHETLRPVSYCQTHKMLDTRKFKVVYLIRKYEKYF
jgi:hypothetical protein